MADVVLGGWGEDGFGQAIGFAEACRQLDAADGAGLLVVLPSGAGEIAADDALHGEHLGAFDQHAATVQLAEIGLELAGKLCGIGGDEVVGDDVSEKVEPEERELGEDLAFVGNAAAQDVVEGGDAVGGDEEELLAR